MRLYPGIGCFLCVIVLCFWTFLRAKPQTSPFRVVAFCINYSGIEINGHQSSYPEEIAFLTPIVPQIPEIEYNSYILFTIKPLEEL
jgi:hypothetical protein